MLLCVRVSRRKKEEKEERERRRKTKTLSFSLTVRRAARSLSHTTESDKEAKKKDLLFRKKSRRKRCREPKFGRGQGKK